MSNCSAAEGPGIKSRHAIGCQTVVHVPHRGTTRRRAGQAETANARSVSCCTRRATSPGLCDCCAAAAAAPRPSSPRAWSCSTRHAFISSPDYNLVLSTYLSGVQGELCTVHAHLADFRRVSRSMLPYEEPMVLCSIEVQHPAHDTSTDLCRRTILHVTSSDLTLSTDGKHFRKGRVAWEEGGSKASFRGKMRGSVQMKNYCTNDNACRHSLLLDYFGERFAGGRCGQACDNCLARHMHSPRPDGIWQVHTLRYLPLMCCRPGSPSCPDFHRIISQHVCSLSQDILPISAGKACDNNSISAEDLPFCDPDLENQVSAGDRPVCAVRSNLQTAFLWCMHGNDGAVCSGRKSVRLMFCAGWRRRWWQESQETQEVWDSSSRAHASLQRWSEWIRCGRGIRQCSVFAAVALSCIAGLLRGHCWQH